MNLGATELIIILFILAMFALPIYAAIRAFKSGDNGWGIGILIAMLVPFGFVVAIAYLASQRSRLA